MEELKCPNCGTVFQIDENGYARLLQQVRDAEFNRELSRREAEIKKQQLAEAQVSRLEQEKKQEHALSEKDREITEKEQEISRLKSDLEKREIEQVVAIKDALSQKEKELSAKEVTILALKGDLSRKESDYLLKEKSLREQYEEQLAYYKDFKARQSTKMIGESLEQHCLTQFNAIRMTAFPTAYFEKDNDARTGSKGDFIYRECAEDGTEFISVMFEMKNESDTTATKHKNEDYFKELDKDRREKGCEYAVLVSLLESDSDFYNHGIVDVSYRYPKMYVIRPQFFIPIITLLRNAALNTLKYRQELAVIKNQQVDILHFEDNMNAFKEGFARNYRLASEKFNTAIDEIDKSISHLQKIKENLLSSENNLRLANKKAEDLSIKKLTKDAPSVREMFENLPEKGS